MRDIRARVFHLLAVLLQALLARGKVQDVRQEHLSTLCKHCTPEWLPMQPMHVRYVSNTEHGTWMAGACFNRGKVSPLKLSSLFK